MVVLHYLLPLTAVFENMVFSNEDTILIFNLLFLLAFLYFCAFCVFFIGLCCLGAFSINNN